MLTKTILPKVCVDMTLNEAIFCPFLFVCVVVLNEAIFFSCVLLLGMSFDHLVLFKYSLYMLVMPVCFVQRMCWRTTKENV